MRKAIHCTIYFLLLLTALETRSAELLPPPFQLPKTPETNAGPGTQKNDERPYFDVNGSARIDLNLFANPIIPNCLLSVSIGRDLSFFPAEQYRIYFPNHQKGVKDYVLVRIGDQKILFKHKTDEKYATYFQSWNYPHMFIKRNEARLAVTDNRQRMEYMFSTLDSGYTWILDEIRDIDFPGRFLKIEYNDKDLLKSVILPDNSKYTVEYNPAGLVSKVTDPDGAFTLVTWDDKSQLKQIKSCLPPEHPLYPKDNPAKLNSKIVAAAVKTLNIECDSSGRMTSLINSYGEKYTVEYRSDKNESSSYFCSVMKNPDGTMEFCKVAWKQEKKEGDKKAGPKTEEISRGRVTLDAKGKEQFEALDTRTYEKKGNAYAETSRESKGVKSSISYNPDGTPASFTDSKGGVTKYSYDGKGSRTGVAYPDGTGSSCMYDENFHLVLRKDEKGVETKYSYDKLGHLVEASEAGAATKYTYGSDDAAPFRTTMPDGTAHIFTWDKLFRMTSHTLPDGTALKYTYMGRSGRLMETEAVSQDGKSSETKKFSYAPAGQLAKITYSDGKSEKYQYKNGCVIRHEDRSGKITAYTYDSCLRKTSEQDGDGRKGTFKYDKLGDLEEMKVAGRTFKNDYDSDGRLIRHINPDGSWVSFSYDEMGRKVKERYSDRTESVFTYDGRNRILTVTGSHSDSMTNVYNDKGLLASTTVVRKDDAEKKELKTSFEYDDIGRKVKTTFTDGSEEKMAYLDNGDTVRIRNGTMTYTKLDTCGRITAVSEFPQELFEQSKTKEEKRELFDSHVTRKYTYSLFGDLLKIENIPPKQLSASAK